MSRAEDRRRQPAAARNSGVAELLKRGVATPPRAPLDLRRLLDTPVVRLTEGATASEIIVAERRERG